MGHAWTSVRDAVEGAASLAGNYVLPGSSIVTDNLVSKGAQKGLSSPLGQLAQAGTGLAGAGVGSSVTGIPASTGWSDLGNAVGLGGSAAPAAGAVTDGTVAGNSLGVMAPAVDPGIANIAPSSLPTAITDAGNMAATAPTATTSTGLAAQPTGVGAGANIGAPSADIAGISAGAPISNPPVAEPVSSLTQAPAPVSTATPTPTSSGTLSGLKSLGQSLGLVNEAGTGIGKNALPAVGLGMNAYGQIAARKAMQDAQKAQEAALQPMQAAQQKILDQYNKGQLNPADAAHIQQWTDQQLAQVRQYYASSGLSGSDMAKQAEAQIMQQGESMRQQALQNLLSSGISATGAVTQPLAQMATAQVAQDQQLQNAMANFMKASATTG